MAHAPLQQILGEAKKVRGMCLAMIPNCLHASMVMCHASTPLGRAPSATYKGARRVRGSSTQDRFLTTAPGLLQGDAATGSATMERRRESSPIAAVPSSCARA